jgi:hypothetical protein
MVVNLFTRRRRAAWRQPAGELGTRPSRGRESREEARNSRTTPKAFNSKAPGRAAHPGCDRPDRRLRRRRYTME